MDRRSWPWKKRSSDKKGSATDAHTASLPSPGDDKMDQDDTESAKYIQISVESYSHLTELENQVKLLNEKLSGLTDKLSLAQSESVTKDKLVKQHAKVAEEAVLGWEKAEAEALALKEQLESVTLLKLTAEGRASHLDGALKECMKQVQNVKEESEKKLHDIVSAKTKQWEKAKAEFEAKIFDSEQALLRSSAEIAALSRSLHERSNMLMKISDEKSQADAEIEVMKTDIQSCEREINSLKYEVHVISKELEIRNEEKNMSVRSAEVANKQHLEDVKKIAKLEAECQRLRGLVRKKLPGPAALAQMKIEVENLGRDHGDSKFRRSPARSSSPRHPSPSEFLLDNMQQCRKENEFLTARLLTMEEEMKMLKEALAMRNSELQAARDMCAKAANELRSMEARFLEMDQQKSLNKSITEVPVETKIMSGVGIDGEVTSDVPQLKNGRSVDMKKNADNSNQLELMDDFLEMERLAWQSPEPDRDGSEQVTVELQKTLVSSGVVQPALESTPDKDDSALTKLQSRITCLFESQAHDAEMGKLLEGIRCIVQDTHEELLQPLVGSVSSETPLPDSCMQKANDEVPVEVKENGNCEMVQDLKDAISRIHEFVLLIGKESTKGQGESFNSNGLIKEIEEFSASLEKVLRNEESLHAFLLALSRIFCEKSLLTYIMAGEKCNEMESCGSDFIDKVTLLENKVVENKCAKEKFSVSCMPDSSPSDPEIEGPINSSCELQTTDTCSWEELEKLKVEKERVDLELARCKEMYDVTNHQLVEMEQGLSELKSQLAASEKSNSLAETQLKCMAESYKSLESQKQELESELNLLRNTVEMLEKELSEEKKSHQDDLVKYTELHDQIERNSKFSVPPEVDIDISQQEREIAAAAEKLAACQETILLLGKQINSLRPPSESNCPSPSRTQLRRDTIMDNEPGASPRHFQQSEVETAVSSAAHRMGAEPPLHGYHHQGTSGAEWGSYPNSPLNPNNLNHMPSGSTTSSSSSNSGTEKQGRGFSRFFSKGKTED